MEFDSFSAQGTIEYLVIVATIIVIALIAVGLFITLSNSPSQQVIDSSSKAGEVAVGGISIVESVVDPDGDSLIYLSNNSSDSITLKKISAGSVDNNFDNVLVGLDSKGFSLSGLSSSCPCTSGQKSVKCEFKIEYQTVTGITKTEYRTINVQCVTDSSASNPDILVKPVDIVPPSIVLVSPGSSVLTKEVEFSFRVTDSSEIQSCILYVGNDSNTYSNISRGLNTITYSFLQDSLLDWNLSCTDTKSNTGVSLTQSLDVDSNDYQITSCTELQSLNDYDGNYELMNDINCSSIANFSPIAGAQSCFWGSCQPVNSFSGLFDGKNYSITDLHINGATQFVGLFGSVYLGAVSNLNLDDVLITCYGQCGAVAGVLTGSVNNVSVTGTINASGASVGGLAGQNAYDMSYGNNKVLNSSFDGIIYANGDFDTSVAGGLVGLSMNLDINNSTSAGTLYNYSTGPASQYAVSFYDDLTVTNSSSTMDIQ